MRSVFALSILMLFASPVHAQTWYGRDIAATAKPLATVEPTQKSTRQPRGREQETIDRGWRAQRSVYVDALGRVTVFAGAPPYWAVGPSQVYEGNRPGYEQNYGNSSGRRQGVNPCAPGIGGAASASSAIGAAASASGRRC